MPDERRIPEQTEVPRAETEQRPLDGYRRGNGREQEQQPAHKEGGEDAAWTRHDVGHPGRTFVLVAVVVLVVVFGALLLLGYIPRHRREQQAAEAARVERESIPTVTVAEAKRAPAISELLLPGNITAVTEASIFARAAGYVRRRYVDIGDRVRQGQVLAEIDAPELDQEVAQGRAALAQAEQQLTQAQAQLQQNRAQLELNRITRDRYAVLVKRGALSRQEGDNQETAYRTQEAAVNSFEANVRAAEDNVRASRANLDRLIALRDFKNVRAPFTGVITARNFDLGALVSTTGGPQGGLTPLPGSTPNSSAGSASGELFRMAQIGILRILINVPQSVTPDIHVGMGADVLVAEYAGRRFDGKVTRTANAVDLNSRTLLTEVDVQNPQQLLLPGMYAQIQLRTDRAAPPLLIPSDAVIADAAGLRVAVLANLPAEEQQQVEERERKLAEAERGAEQGDQQKPQSPPRRIHLQQVTVGRDYGAEMEILTGLQPGAYVVVNPSDVVKEGAVVRGEGHQGAQPGGGAPGGRSTGGIQSATPGEANRPSAGQKQK
ncbi:MAG TPA: efflux RND transporter periplasmic adaptor subunit [Bryobacteraceae bacterium]|nr:efflux RND transporter periplasmic adaptor subunit [Bryobacteraceae bacterium]